VTITTSNAYQQFAPTTNIAVTGLAGELKGAVAEVKVAVVNTYTGSSVASAGRVGSGTSTRGAAGVTWPEA
jgi:hypothetical protein